MGLLLLWLVCGEGLKWIVHRIIGKHKLSNLQVEKVRILAYIQKIVIRTNVDVYVAGLTLAFQKYWNLKDIIRETCQSV